MKKLLLIFFISSFVFGQGLTGLAPSSTYKDLLYMNHANTGIDATLRYVYDGKGTASALQVSTTSIGFPSPFTLGATSVTATGVQFNYLGGATGTTGTGNLVFGTSPVLVTPSLGTPSALTLTNATGLPLTTGVTGILPIANGGTNNSTAYTAGSVIFSNGTSLTQDNANFYWDNVNKRLGVGTTNPGAQLDITQKFRVLSGAEQAITSGTGLEILYNNADDTANLVAYDRTGSAWKPIRLRGSYTTLESSGTEVLRATGGKVGIGQTTFLRSTKFGVTGMIMGSDTLWVGNNSVYSYIKPGAAAWTTSSSFTKKTNIQNVSGVNLANFSQVTPVTYNFKKENFVEQFDEKSVPDSINKEFKVKVTRKDKEGKEFEADSSYSVRVSNKAVKDSIRAKFIADNDKKATLYASLSHTGFIAQDFYSKLFNKPNATEINYNDITAVMWLKISELETRIQKLGGKK